MSFECGIVGLPNVGKSTLFNTLTASQVPAENFPFCTVDPNKGIVELPDERFDKIVEMVNPKGTVRTHVTFVDIAGLVKGASQGEGLGNQFLSHIRSVDAIVHVVRCFRDDNVTHVMGGVDPMRDVEIIELELCMADLDSVKKRIERVARQAKAGIPEARAELEVFEQMEVKLSAGEPLRRSMNDPKHSAWKNYDLPSFLTAKPVMYLANIAESEVVDRSSDLVTWLKQLSEVAKRDGAPIVDLSVALEYQLSQLEDQDRASFFEEYKLKEPGLHRLIREAYKLLGLITFFTAGEKEVRAWTIQKGQTAVDAAGCIHSDFAKGFIRAEVIHFEDFVSCGGERIAREKGLQRSEGRDYVVLDGDVLLFRFNV